MRIFRVVIGTVLILALGLLAALPWLVPLRGIRSTLLRRARRTWARGLCWLLRVRVQLEPADADLSGAALYAANHSSYLDIPVVMSVAPGVFVSKSSVRWWPVLGQLAVIGGTLFADRGNRFSIGQMVERARRRLLSGTSIIFFPEATSSNGEGLLPFKSSLFAAAGEGADGRQVPVRPLVLCYRRLNGRALDVSSRDQVFWYGEMRLPGHLWNLLGAKRIEVTIKVLPERSLSGDRRRFAAALREDMLQAVEKPGTGAGGCASK